MHLCSANAWQSLVRQRNTKHRYKYRLFFGESGITRVRYDNERGKGDHRHVGDREYQYTFNSVEQLLADFQFDVERWESS
jgi:hypothetical protein